MAGIKGAFSSCNIQHPTLSFRYGVLDMRAIDATPLLESPAVEDTVLALLCRCDDLTERVRAIVRRLCRHRPPEARRAAMQFFMLSPLRRAEILVVKEVRTMPITVNLSESPVMKEMIDEIIARKLAEKLEEKLTERERAEEARLKAGTLMRQLQRRFGVVPLAVWERVAGADLTALDLWLDRIIDAPDLEAVFAPPSPAG